MTRATVLGALLFVAVGCSPPTAEDKAAEFVKGLGGNVDRDESLPGKPVTDAHLRETRVTDADLKNLAPLTHLRAINLSRTRVTDAGMKELTGLSSLTALSIRDTSVTDAGLKDIAQIKTLKSLYVGGSHVTEAGLKEFLRALPTCEISQ